MYSKCIINLRFHFIVALSLILFIFQLSYDLDVNPQYFENINGIEVAEAEDGFFTFDPNEYFEEDNVPQNSTKNNQLKQSENEINNNTNNSKVKISNKNEGNYKNNTKDKNTNDTDAINQSTYISNHTSKDFNLVAVGD